MHTKHFKGQILFKSHEFKGPAIAFMDYEAPHGDPELSQTLMGQFNEFNFTAFEKSKLTVAHRKLLAQFKAINVFNLKIEMQKFIEHIKHTADKKFEIHVEGYGAFIAMAAIYSGEMPKDKTIDFFFSNMPIALFPKNLAKTRTIPKNYKMTFEVQQHSWIEPFSTLMGHNEIKCKFLKVS